MILLIWAIVLIAAFVLFYKQAYSLFSKHGVKGFTPLPFFGNMGRIVIKMDHFSDHIQSLYDSFPEERYDLFIAVYDTRMRHWLVTCMTFDELAHINS